MRLFIGTLYTNENEFDECLVSINNQSYRNFDHYVFKNLPNKEAHVTLFKSFLDKANEYDVLIKVDADMVLANDDLFGNIVNVLTTNQWAKILSVAVYDFFSDQLIWGLNAYRNNVRWNLDKENLFVDIPEVPSEEYLFDDINLAPAAVHCKNPSPFQAFHYGIHRGLKVIQPGRREKRESSSRSHWSTLNRTWENFLSKKDVRIGLASLGAELAYTGLFTIQDLDYKNPKTSQVLEKYMGLDFDSLSREIKKLRILNWGFLPSSRRRKIICGLHQAIYSKIPHSRSTKQQ